MTQTYASWKSLHLVAKLTAAATSLTWDVDLWVTKWRLFAKNDSQREWISFWSVTAVWDWTYTYWSLVRWLSQTADPSTTWTWSTWLANQEFVLVAMHDQLIDKQQWVSFTSTTISWLNANNLTTTQRLALTPVNWDIVYDTTLWELYQYIGWAWSAVSAGSTQPNASTTVAWKVEIATSAQSIAWTDTWETWALLSVLPSDIAKNIQSWCFITGTAAWADTKTMTLTPTLTAYWTWIYVVTNTTVNTWAVTLNIDWLWAKAVQTLEWWALIAWDMANTTTYLLYYDWTQFKLCATVPANADRKGIVEMLTDVEATAHTDETRYINSKQVYDNYWMVTDTVTFTRASDATTATVAYNHSLWKAPKQILFTLICAQSNWLWYSHWSWSSKTNVSKCVTQVTDTGANSKSDTYCLFSWNAATSAEQKWAVSAVSTTNFSIDWTLVWSPSTQTLLWIATLIA